MVESQGKMMRLKPADIDHIIDLIKQITDALTKRDFLTQQEQSQLQRYHSYENWLKLDMDMSRLNSRPFNKQEDERRRNEISYNPNVSQQLKDKLSGAQKEHIDSTIKPLQKKLDLYLTPRWHELLALSTKANQFRQEIESFLSYQFDCRTIERFLRAVSGVYGFDDALLASKEKVVPELQRIKAKLEYKQAETEHDIKPVKASKLKSLATESQSARIASLLSAAAELKQIADNFESWAKKQHARFVDPNGVKPPAFNLAQVEDWVNTYLSKQRLIAVFFDHPHLSYDINSGLTPFLTTFERKEFHLIIDVFRLHMPAIATSLKELYDEFWEDVRYHIECHKRSKRVQQEDIPLSTLIGESMENVSWVPILFLDGAVATLIRRLRHIAEMVREELATEKPAEPEQRTAPAKRERIKRIIGWIFKGFIALTLLLICLYVFGVVTGIFIFAALLTIFHYLGWLEQITAIIEKILPSK